MSDAENFLSRWSKRKHDAAREPRAEKPAERAQPVDGDPDSAPAGLAAAEEPAIDLTQLPPLESITAETDISAFLKPGVPAHLSQAALRRAWSTDPAIRDFIGLSENSWDFNTPGGVPGFGAIDPKDVAALLRRVMGELESEPVAPVVEDGAPVPATAATPAAEAVSAHSVLNVAAQQEAVLPATEEGKESQEREQVPLRRHGGALPD